MNSQTAQPVPAHAPDPCAITAEILLEACENLKPEEAFVHARALDMARGVGELTTTRRVRHFLAQCAHETMGFKRLEENLNYRDPVRLDQMFKAVRDVHHARALIAGGAKEIANCVYANRCGNGDRLSFDGWNFRGRGYLHHTFRDNHVELEKLTGLPFVKEPHRLTVPEDAAVAAAAWWKAHGCNRRADADDSQGVSLIINPGRAGLAERTAWSARFRPFYP